MRAVISAIRKLHVRSGLRFAGFWFGAWFLVGIVLEVWRELGPAAAAILP
jgi:hypothetical protein